MEAACSSSFRPSALSTVSTAVLGWASRRRAVWRLDDAGESHVLYNPRLVFGLGASKMEESCLTHEEVTKSTRYIKCKVAFDQIVDGKMKECRRDYAGFEAQMIQHMIDHCLGKLV